MRIHKDIQSIRAIDKPILTIGTFDGVHLGHRVIIDRLNTLAEEVGGESVLLTFHPHPRTVVMTAKDIELLSTMEERLDLLAESGLQHVIIHPFTHEFSRISALEYVRDLLVNRIGVHYCVVGYDHHFGRNREGDIHLLKELSETYGFEVEEISAQTIEEVEVSSTKVRKALKAGEVDKVRSFLGYDYAVEGTVVKGDGRGRGLGFPTANVLPDDQSKLIPGQGVYAVHVEIGEATYPGMLNIGTRPTFHVNDTAVSIMEVHLIGFSADLYGHQLRIVFKRFIRAERKFDSAESLSTQLTLDKEACVRILE